LKIRPTNTTNNEKASRGSYSTIHYNNQWLEDELGYSRQPILERNAMRNEAALFRESNVVSSLFIYYSLQLIFI